LVKPGGSGKRFPVDLATGVATELVEHSGESAPPDPSLAAIAAQAPTKKEKQAPKKRQGEAEKLLEDQLGCSKRRSTAKDKVTLQSSLTLYKTYLRKTAE
jgi:hypothetical protein